MQPIASNMLEEIRRHILDRDPLIDDSDLARASDRSGGRVVPASVVSAGNSANNAGSLQPIELAEERFILEEDDTSSDSDSNGSEENDEEREEESNGKWCEFWLESMKNANFVITAAHDSKCMRVLIRHK